MFGYEHIRMLVTKDVSVSLTSLKIFQGFSLKLQDDFQFAELIRLTLHPNSLTISSQIYSFPSMLLVCGLYIHMSKSARNLQRLQSKNCDLRPAIKSYKGAGHSNPAVCIQPHLPNPIKSRWIFSSPKRQNRRSQKWNNNLPAM